VVDLGNRTVDWSGVSGLDWMASTVDYFTLCDIPCRRSIRPKKFNGIKLPQDPADQSITKPLVCSVEIISGGSDNELESDRGRGFQGYFAPDRPATGRQRGVPMPQSLRQDIASYGLTSTNSVPDLD
jgi:hypothetical protein